MFVRGTFIMNGGKICSNQAKYGGGVFVYNEFIMHGGTISENMATEGFGGGVNLNDFSTFEMTGGTISGNTSALGGGGVFLANESTFEVSGAPNVTGNKKADGSNNNVEVNYDSCTVTGELTEGAQIGIYSTGKAVCDNCGKEYGEIDSTNHDFAEEFAVDKEATCTEAGSKSKHCSRCDEKSQVTEIAVIPHTLTHHEATAATEEKEGNKEYWSCGDCDNYFSDETGETVISDKTGVTLPKLKPAEPEPTPTPTPEPEPTPAPAEEKKSYVWICWLLIPLLLAVAGVILGVWLYEKNKNK